MNSNAAGGDKIRTLRAVAAPAQLTRTRLLDDYLAILPRLVVIAAPAGYGKSTVARQIASCFEQTAICDCAAVDSERQLWYKVLAAIGKAHRTSGLEAIAARAGVSGDPSLANVLALLGDLGRPILLTFENAERAFADPGLRRALQRLVGASPRTCTTVLCSRTGARLKLSKFAAPHEMLVWRVRDLAFDRAKSAQFLRPVKSMHSSSTPSTRLRPAGLSPCSSCSVSWIGPVWSARYVDSTKSTSSNCMNTWSMRCWPNFQARNSMRFNVLDRSGTDDRRRRTSYSRRIKHSGRAR